MSLTTQSTTQTTILPWDTLKSTAKDSVDQFIDAAQPHVATLVKTTAVAAVSAAATAGGSVLKAGVATNCPAAAPLANVAIDTTTGPVVAFATQSASPLIDSSVQKTGEVAKVAAHQSVDIGVDLTSRSFSMFGN